VTGHYRKYKSISRRKFILSTTGAIAGITAAGVVGISCIRKPVQPKTDLVEIDYIGPETLFPVYLSHFKKFKKTILHFKSLEEALFTGSNGSIVLLPLIQKAPVLLMLLQMDKDVLTPFPLAKDYEEFDALQKQSNLSDRRIAMLDPLRFWEPVQYFSSQIQSRIGSVRHIELIVNQTRPAESYLPPADGFTGNAARLIRLISCILKRNPSGLVIRHNDLLKLEVDFNGISLLCSSDSKSDGWSIVITGENLNISLNSEGILTGIKDIPGNHREVRDEKLKSEALAKNIGDFITVIRSRKEPEINALDGMSAIALDLAAVESTKEADIQSL
jgi:predicted dehydrogenase